MKCRKNDHFDAKYAKSAIYIGAGVLRRAGGLRRLTIALPELLDAKALQTELGITRAAAEKIMRQLPVVQFEGLRKVYVRRGEVARLLEERTFTKDQVAA